jgi:hypothetical protein
MMKLKSGELVSLATHDLLATGRKKQTRTAHCHHCSSGVVKTSSVTRAKKCLKRSNRQIAALQDYYARCDMGV